MSCLPVRSQGDRHCWLLGPQRRLFRPAAHAYRRRHEGSTWGGGQHLDGGAGAGVDVGRLLGVLHLHHDIFVFYLLAPRALMLGLIKDFQVSKLCLNEHGSAWQCPDTAMQSPPGFRSQHWSHCVSHAAWPQ